MSQTTHRTTRRQPAPAEPDLVDRIFEYIFKDPALGEAVRQIVEQGTDVMAIKSAVREELGGREIYLAKRTASERSTTAQAVLSMFNGRNATEVARTLRIGRTTVYRILKQAGRRVDSRS